MYKKGIQLSDGGKRPWALGSDRFRLDSSSLNPWLNVNLVELLNLYIPMKGNHIIKLLGLL